MSPKGFSDLTLITHVIANKLHIDANVQATKRMQIKQQL